MEPLASHAKTAAQSKVDEELVCFVYYLLFVVFFSS